jgi:uncharacterized SAM-binding protein YcdF (DUF218 family)
MSYEMNRLNDLKQILVPGREIETNDNQHPGTVILDSPSSADSYDRAVAATSFVDKHRNVVRTIFSGRFSIALSPDMAPNCTEAEAMREVAINHGLQPEGTIVDSKARTTYENFLNAVPLVDPNSPLGVVLHENYKDRALKIGALVMPDVELICIPADNPERTTYSSKLNVNDLVAAAIYKVYMSGVTRGDVSNIRRRDHKVQNLVEKIVMIKSRFSKGIRSLRARHKPATE